MDLAGHLFSSPTYNGPDVRAQHASAARV